MKAFTEENFDPIFWINETLKSGETSDNKENFVSNIVYKLQLFVQEINQSLEESAQSVINNVTKFNREVDRLRQEADDFKQDLMDIKLQIEHLKGNTSDSIKNLIEIDQMKKQI